MSIVRRQSWRSGASTVHHQRHYSGNFFDSSSNGRWLQSTGLQHLKSSNPSVPPLQDYSYLRTIPLLSKAPKKRNTLQSVPQFSAKQCQAVAGIPSKSSQGGMRVRDGRSRFNRIFEFAYTIHGQQWHMLFTSVTGHLMELDFEDRYRKWHSCDPLLYQAPVRKFVPEDKLDIKRTLEEEARKCQWLVLWLECDREGENIAFEVVEVCTGANLP